MSEGRKLTAHEYRMIVVRDRINKIIPKIEVPSRGFRTTPYSIFAERAYKIAADKGITLSTAKTLNKASGIPKDASRSLRRFCEGKVGTYERLMDVYELTCIEYEQEARERRAEARQHLKVVPGTPEAAEAVSAPVDAVQQASDMARDPHPINAAGVTVYGYGYNQSPPTSGYTPPTEFDAAKTISEILGDFDKATCGRILRYVAINMEERADDGS